MVARAPLEEGHAHEERVFPGAVPARDRVAGLSLPDLQHSVALPSDVEEVRQAHGAEQVEREERVLRLGVDCGQQREREEDERGCDEVDQAVLRRAVEVPEGVPLQIDRKGDEEVGHPQPHDFQHDEVGDPLVVVGNQQQRCQGNEDEDEGCDDDAERRRSLEVCLQLAVRRTRLHPPSPLPSPT